MDSPTLDEFLILTAADRGDLVFFQNLEENTPKWALRLRCENAKTSQGITAIHLAATKGRLEICRFLIENARININIESENGNRALIIAVQHGHNELAKYLISRGANINACNHEMKTALHFAVAEKNTELIQLLLSYGANVKAVTTKGQTALELAAINAHLESIQLLLFYGAQPNYTAMVSVITQRSPECLEALLKAEADPNADPLVKTPLVYAAETGEVHLIKLLLEAGANPNKVCRCGWKAIEHAAKAEKREAVALLFLVTEKITYIHNWNVDGTMEFHSPFWMFSGENVV